MFPNINRNKYEKNRGWVMKKIWVALGVLVVAGCWSGLAAFADAGTPSHQIPVTVDVPKMLNLDCTVFSETPNDPRDPKGIHIIDSTFNPIVTSMTFTLHWDSTFHLWFGDQYFCVLLAAGTSHRPYRITQSCSQIIDPVSGANLNNSLLMSPDYQGLDQVNGVAQGDLDDKTAVPNEVIHKGKTFALGNQKPIFDSALGTTRLIRCYYGLPTGGNASAANPSGYTGTDVEPGGTQLLTADTQSGTYTGTVTFTVTLKGP